MHNLCVACVWRYTQKFARTRRGAGARMLHAGDRRAVLAMSWCPSSPRKEGLGCGRQANGVDPCLGGILILLGRAPAAAHGTEEFAVAVDG